MNVLVFLSACCRRVFCAFVRSAVRKRGFPSWKFSYFWNRVRIVLPRRLLQSSGVLRFIRDLSIGSGVLPALSTVFCWVSRVISGLAHYFCVVELTCLLLICWFALSLFNVTVSKIAILLSACSFSGSIFFALLTNAVKSSGLSFYIKLLLLDASWGVRLVHWCLVERLWRCCWRKLVKLLSPR